MADTVVEGQVEEQPSVVQAVDQPEEQAIEKAPEEAKGVANKPAEVTETIKDSAQPEEAKGEASKPPQATEAIKESAQPGADAVTGKDEKDVTAVAGSKDGTADTKTSDSKAVEAPSNGRKAGRSFNDRKKHKFQSRNKFDPTSLPDTDDPVEIRKQVEFYFSDSNLPNDKYLLQLTGGEKNTPVKLKTICGFKRMHRFKPYSAVVAALRDSESLTVSGPEGDEEIQRKEGYSASARDEAKELAATVYVKGFGEEQPATVFDIEAWFVKYGPVNSIRLRRTQEKWFKGSVFVEFSSEEQAQKFLDLDPKPQWQGNDLVILSKKAYLEQKGKERTTTRKREDDDEVDPRDWKKRRHIDQKNGFRNNRGGKGGRGG